MRLHLSAAAFVVALVILTKPSVPVVHAEPLLLDDPSALMALEDRGLSFTRVVGPDRLRQIAKVVERDMRELTRGHPKDDPRRPFDPKWLTRGRFELTGLVNRIDRRRFDSSTCGEARLVYRLVLENPRRPPTRLPMTVNVRIPQPMLPGETDCRMVAKRWLDREDAVAIVRSLPPPAQIEINFQSLHAPGARRDMDDSAGYVLRSFAVTGPTSLEVDGLFNTPRADVPPGKLLDWVKTHAEEIDDNRAVLPRELLAERVVSVSPRGLARPENRPFSTVMTARDLDNEAASNRMKVATTPELFLRRLDEMTCVGCHQSRGVAGFHLLGEERTTKSFNALAVGHSPHLGDDLEWRAIDLAHARAGTPSPPRPFASYPKGALGDDCSVIPGLASFGCKPGLTCKDAHVTGIGLCAEPYSKRPGAPCEELAEIVPSDRAEGPIVTTSKPDEACPAPAGDQLTGAFCAPNWLGFTGGMCSERCDAGAIGERRADGSICAPLPAAGYEADCFLSREPIERCLDRHFVTAWVASCDAHHPCRADYGCARVPNAPRATGACVPPYFIFQARVDGPLLDR